VRLQADIRTSPASPRAAPPTIPAKAIPNATVRGLNCLGPGVPGFRIEAPVATKALRPVAKRCVSYLQTGTPSTPPKEGPGKIVSRRLESVGAIVCKSNRGGSICLCHRLGCQVWCGVAVNPTSACNAPASPPAKPPVAPTAGQVQNTLLPTKCIYNAF
jgi:hypothetical protein